MNTIRIVVDYGFCKTYHAEKKNWLGIWRRFTPYLKTEADALEVAKHLLDGGVVSVHELESRP